MSSTVGSCDQYFLEAALQRGVFFDVLAILIERRRADAMQLAAGQRRLQHVAGVHRAFGLTGTHHRVQFVDKQNDLAFLFRQIAEHGLKAFFKFAAEFRARDERAQVEGEDALPAQALRHFVVDDPLRQTFNNRGLAHARLTNQHRVVLGAPLENLDGAANFIVSADDRIELALLRPLGEIDRVLVERLAPASSARPHTPASAPRDDATLPRLTWRWSWTNMSGS